MAINCMQACSDASAGLRELRRVLKHGGRAALAFSIHCGQQKQGVQEMMAAAGFIECYAMEMNQAYCVLATGR